MVNDRCFVFNNLRYNLAAALVPPFRLDNDTDHGTGAVPFKAVDMKFFQLFGEKRCAKCGAVKSIDRFAKNNGMKNGRDSYCKDCRILYARENRDRIIANTARWQKEHPEKAREHSRNWKEKNPEKVKAYKKNMSAEAIQARREYDKEYRARNLEKKKLLVKLWKKANPERVQAHRNNRRAWESGGSITAQEWLDLKAKYNYTCLCCGRREPEIKLTLDHVKPLKLGGENIVKNAQPLCFSCNSSKGTKHIDYRPWWNGRLF